MRRGTRGFSLVEVMISTAVLAVLVLAIYALIDRGSSGYANATRNNTLQQNSRNVLERVAEELRIANPDTLIVGTINGTGSLSFQTSTGFSGGATLWGSTIQYSYELSTADANNNGVQDEGRLVRSQDGIKATLCDYVQPGGFVITQSGQRITLTINLFLADEKNRIVTSSVSTSILLRNKSSS